MKQLWLRYAELFTAKSARRIIISIRIVRIFNVINNNTYLMQECFDHTLTIITASEKVIKLQKGAVMGEGGRINGSWGSVVEETDYCLKK